MNTKLLGYLLIFLVSACQTATPPPSITGSVDEEITLEPGQSATIMGADLTITFNSVQNDERCPSEMECAESGPVTILFSLRQTDGIVTDLTLQTFTDYQGRAPDRPFEGIKDRVEVGDYLMRIMSVLPYPKDLDTEIKPSDYQATIKVIKK